MGSDTTSLLPATRVRWRGQPEVAPETCLVLIYGANLGAKIHVRASRVVIGRDPSCDIVIPDTDVSRNHCALEQRDGAWFVSDLGSTNGTRVGDARALAEGVTPIRSGDHLRIGGVVFKFFDGSNVEVLYHEEIHRMAVEDGLTGLHNRRYLLDFLDREMSRARRHGSPLSLALFDLDNFKSVNDEFGHVAGDDVLREVAQLSRSVIRLESCLARYGGEEFAVVLPDTPPDGARGFGERLRGTVEAHRFEVDVRTVEVTISVGVATFEPGMLLPSAFIGAADARLYEAKQAGRNCVVDDRA